MKLHQRILIILIAGLLATGLLLLRIHRDRVEYWAMFSIITLQERQ